MNQAYEEYKAVLLALTYLNRLNISSQTQDDLDCDAGRHWHLLSDQQRKQAHDEVESLLSQVAKR